MEGRGARRLLQHWGGRRPTEVAFGLLAASYGLLFLHAAATVEISFTIQISYAVLLAACVVAAPRVVLGWHRLPRWQLAFSLGLIASYLIALILGSGATVHSLARASSLRGVAYTLDVIFGLAIVGLVSGVCWTRRRVLLLVWCLTLAAFVAGAYGLYQWFALRYHLPLANVNNAVNSNGVTTGEVFQGTGPLGGERVRGTFAEPHFFGVFLASMLPLALVVPQTFRRIPLRVLYVTCLGLALVLTGSVPAMVTLVIAVAAALLARTLALGRKLVPATIAVGLAAVIAASVLLVADPSVLTSLTGRAASQLQATTQFRLDSWASAVRIWSHRPMTGFGPGQSSVQLARPIPYGPGAGKVVLGTANGIWAAALIDGGVVETVMWILVLVGFLVLGARTLRAARRSACEVGVFAAVVAATLSSQIDGDRLDLAVWLLIGSLAALASVSHRAADEKMPRLTPEGGRRSSCATLGAPPTA